MKSTKKHRLVVTSVNDQTLRRIFEEISVRLENIGLQVDILSSKIAALEREVSNG